MREYEFTVVFDLAVMEEGGPEASVEALTAHVEARGGRVLSVDHWGRRRMAYPVNRAIDGDYVVARIELPPTSVQALNNALRIDERVYRHLLVRADELPPPPAVEEEEEPAAVPAQAAQPAERAAKAAPEPSPATPDSASPSDTATTEIASTPATVEAEEPRAE